MESIDIWSCRMDRPRLGFLAPRPPLGSCMVDGARICSRPTDSADSSLGGSSEAVDDTLGSIFTEHKRSSKTKEKSELVVNTIVLTLKHRIIASHTFNLIALYERAKFTKEHAWNYTL